jgi:hypothetical protein
MLSQSEWRATNPTLNNKVTGFHLSSLCSPVGWYSWSQAVEVFLHSKDNEQLLNPLNAELTL